MINIFHKIKTSKIFFPILLLLLAFLTYGILISFMGFYWDDFPYIWFFHIGGANSVFQAVAADRPVLGLLYGFTLPIIGEHPLTWQIFAILTHWFCSFYVFMLIKEIWPTRENEAKWLAVLFLVFPAFSQHWISIIYSQAFLLFSIYYLSILLMVHAIKNFKRYWLFSIPSLLLSLFSMASSEYTVGLELLRPVIIFIVLQSTEPKSDFKQKLKDSFIRWIPYLASLIIFGIYRIFFASSVLYSVRITDDLLNNPISLIISFLKSALSNLLNAGILAWIKPFTFLGNLNLNHWIDRIFILLVAASSFLIFMAAKFITKSESRQATNDQKKWAKNAIIFGIAAIIVAGIPFFAVKYELILSFPYDRLSIPMTFGSSLLVLGTSLLVIKNHLARNLFLSLLLGFSIGAQFIYANSYREDWENLREFFWQLQWRIPDMQSGTMLLTDKLPLEHYSDNSLTAPLNWLYEKPITDNKMPFILNFLSVRLGNRIPNLEPNTPINQYYRIVNFEGNTSNSLVFQYSPPGCVHILFPELDQYNPNISIDLSVAINLSNLNRIITEKNTQSLQPPFFLGKEPAHNWCFYYEKAALAKQSEKWDEIVKIGEKAFAVNDYPNDPIERLPFIEAYARVGDFGKALELSQKTREISPLYSKMLCALWDNIESSIGNQQFPNELKDFLSNQIQCGTAN